MKLQLPKGRYIMAVSGGVDSVALLNTLSKQKDLSLVVAHFDHGIRPDSSKDRQFVQALAEEYGLPFEYADGNLGPNASEAAAREARYKFLLDVKDKHGAMAIITAHHQDDVVETTIINLLRGTGRKGLTSLASKAGIIRPLLETSKKDILDYAVANKLEWREDSTNTDTSYLRNYVRHELVPKLTLVQKKHLLAIIESQRSVNAQLDELLSLQLWPRTDTLERSWFIGLEHNAAREVMAAWLRTNGIRDFDRPTIERAVVGAKTAKPGKRIAIKKGVSLEVGNNNLALSGQER